MSKKKGKTGKFEGQDQKDLDPKHGQRLKEEAKDEATSFVTDDVETEGIDTENKKGKSPWGEEGPEAEISELKDKLLRALADNENTIRRSKREREDSAKYAAASFARDVLTVADNLKRALDVVPKSIQALEEAKPFLEGVELTNKELLTVMEKHGIQRIAPLGAKFDHNRHEALFEVPTSEKEAGTVAQVIEDGFMIHDRLLRAAKVGVAKAIDASEAKNTTKGNVEEDQKNNKN
ncbi:MAG: nucleotide exchange factor GrpE [Pseudomonadota bacterium]|nr:nucleotide exchange factor GrpE [Pseudomonadota bacterium]